MKKISISICLSVLFLTMGSLLIFANSVTVILNGTVLKYDQVQPTIINDRTMVPIRETAEYLGMVTDWHEDTATMTFTRGSRTAVHVLGENTININGQVKTYDTASQTVDDRTVMPIVMLGDIINATVEWRGESGTVVITSNSQLEIVSAVPNAEYISLGETVSIVVTANLNTAAVQLVDGNNKVLKEVNRFTTEMGSHIFIIEYAPVYEMDEEDVWYVLPGDGRTFYDQFKQKVELVVGREMEIKSMNLSKDSLEKEEAALLTVCTNEGVTKVKVANSYDDEELESSGYEVINGLRYFYFNITMRTEDKTTFTAYPGNSGGYSKAGESIEVSYNTKARLRIETIHCKADSIYAGANVYVTVVTPEAVEMVRVMDRRNNNVATTATYQIDTDGMKNWNLDFKLTESGYTEFYAYAYDGNGERVEQKFDIMGDKTSYPQIYSISVSDRSPGANTIVYISVYTNAPVEGVWLEDKNGNRVDTSSAYARKEGDQYIWELEIRKPITGAYTIYARSETGSTEAASYMFSIVTR